jgi:hypothetical protein
MEMEARDSQEPKKLSSRFDDMAHAFKSSGAVLIQDVVGLLQDGRAQLMFSAGGTKTCDSGLKKFVDGVFAQPNCDYTSSTGDHAGIKISQVYNVWTNQQSLIMSKQGSDVTIGETESVENDRHSLSAQFWIKDK